jgi:ubiquitin-conjugating enzyme E2 W
MSGPPGRAAKPLTKVAQRRLTRELAEWSVKDPPVPGMAVITSDRIDEWYVNFTGPPETVYAGEKFQLRFVFPAEYPMESPEVVFMQPPPRHIHCYTNGYICLNVLYDGWSPALTVTSVCLSIISMLSSAKEKGLPPDNAQFVANCSRSPKSTKWVFHDPTV